MISRLRRLVVIGGPTATGKTSLAAALAKEFDGELISADSRQVYRGMDVGTGKDRPAGVKIWGYDLVNPDEDFSVADWVDFAWLAIRKLWAKNKLPIIVSGTGLYLKSLFDPPESLGVKPDKQLRRELGDWGIERLQQELRRVGPERFRQMNWSDQNNPRRLLRAIEVALGKVSQVAKVEQVAQENIAWVGLTAKRAVLKDRIKKRVIKRASEGMTGEVQKLIKKYNDWTKPAFSATGYREWRDYVESKVSGEEAVDRWQRVEIQYMRRQLTWFKKMPQFTWFDIGQETWQNEARRWICKKLRFPIER
ncbi:MAG: tRNA (adenosine(37)-N6)-dimethylallyltransferase MiaA [Candidatus Chisholmbacteria bacterium RIFCSPHIGHO2_01_FULL_48_12]|uniref:tRNA dimethylallyltransferase n=1 Tax=Candidatus Chisholmbacteria bacterium RIFCSPHIGHO2_01_FULL_48_12 TaxID=1797589 RepID=A0A1G1VR79_9BACT|nr:MAG: tRNA (adenosine(37)-N6)-dimethylallyltransferase MiaA [Candidatus Chisholmbacteria bacterium RIFCSPHIGHO2_01_FULL_48_12]